MKVLVAGGAGFIGSHLSERLIREGHDVVVVDNLSTGKRSNLAGFEKSSRFQFIEHDVVQPLRGDYQLVFNLACPASPPHYQLDPIKTLRTSVIGTDNLLELSESCGALFVQASTSEVYGDPLQHPQPESYWGHVNPIGIRACYDEGKRAAETLCFDHARSRGTRIKVARIFNTYGPRMLPDDGRVVSNLIVQALRGEPLTIYGDGHQTRSFCYVDELVDGLVRLAGSSSDVRGPINLGNPHEFTILELAELVRGAINPMLPLVMKPLPQDDPRQRRPDITLATKQLGWAPTMELAEGLRLTIAYFERLLLDQPRTIAV